MVFADPQQGRHAVRRKGHGELQAGFFQKKAERMEQVPFPCQDGKCLPARPGFQSLKAQQFVHRGPGLVRLIRALDDLNPALGQCVRTGPLAARCKVLAPVIYTNGMPGFHAVAVPGDKGVGRVDYVSCGAIVFHQVMERGFVVFLKAAYELHIGAAELVDVLVVVTHCKDAEFLLVFLKRPSCYR